MKELVYVDRPQKHCEILLSLAVFALAMVNINGREERINCASSWERL
jgi:hypothetical protein